MTSAYALPSALGRRRNRGFTIGVGLGLMLPLTVVLVLSLLPRGGDAGGEAVPADVAEARQALGAFDKALEPVIDAAGATVVYGMRPGINDIHNQALDDAALASMAEGWVESTRTARDDVAAIEVPEFLTETADLYEQAFDAYHQTAQALLAATGATGAERAQHISQAAEHGTRADQLYDTAKAQLAEHRTRLGM